MAHREPEGVLAVGSVDVVGAGADAA